MIEFLTNYALFLAESITVVVAILVVIGGVIVLSSKGNKEGKGDIEVTYFNEDLQDMKTALEAEVLDKNLFKSQQKAEKKAAKQKQKADKKHKNNLSEQKEQKKRLFVLDFDGDIKASDVDTLRHEISAVLALATNNDEIVIRLESAGGMVHQYGLAASQLERIKSKKIPLTICVDRVAASGGYMMACLADKLLVAPFAIVGSIGVIAQLPNFHRLLKKNDIDYEVLTAGEYKRTLTIFGENTEKGRAKFVEELESTHGLFRDFVHEYRPEVNMEEVATGEIWFGRQATSLNLVDELSTSDQYLVDATENADVYLVQYQEKRTLQDKISNILANSSDNILLRWWDRLTQPGSRLR